jgi:FkbM family methyltransferase
MRIFNKQVYFREFIPPILIGPLKQIRNAVLPAAARNATGNIKHAIKPYFSPALESYSQFNEDLLIDLLLLQKKEGFYIDVGANDPVFNSNTKRFYDRGWRGINIEPGVEQFEKIKQARPRDTNLNVGVGPANGSMIFYRVVGDSTLSSFNKSVASNMAKAHGKKVEEVIVSVLRLVDIYEGYVKGSHVDFLSVDAEGLDLEVLKSNDWNKFRPSLVMVEADSQYTEIVGYMECRHYYLLFNNNHNVIFMDRETSEATLKTMIDVKKA